MRVLLLVIMLLVNMNMIVEANKYATPFKGASKKFSKVKLGMSKDGGG